MSTSSFSRPGGRRSSLSITRCNGLVRRSVVLFVNRTVLDGIVQEIEIETGRVLFEWHSLDHIGLEEAGFARRSVGSRSTISTSIQSRWTPTTT